VTTRALQLADAHVHLFRAGFNGRYGRPSAGGNDLSVYQSLMREHSIGLSLVVGYEGMVRYRGNNVFLSGLARQHKWIKPLAYTSVHRPTVPNPPFLGISVYIATSREAEAFANWPKRLIGELNAQEAIVSINGNPETLRIGANALGRLDGCQVLISHIGAPGRFERAPSAREVATALEPLRSLRGMRQVGVKISGLYALTSPMHAYPHSAARPFIERVADSFGTERLYWGSDFSPALDFVSFAQTLHAVSDLPWSESERTQVMGGNLKRLVAASAPARRQRPSR
jgi:L-fuconolactonase